MSNVALRWARGVRGITGTQKLVLHVMADVAKEPAHRYWKPARTLAADCCLSERSVRAAFDDLESRGLIAGHRVEGRPTVWTLLVDERSPGECPDEDEPRDLSPGTEEGPSDLPPSPPRKLSPTSQEAVSAPPRKLSPTPRKELPDTYQLEPKVDQERPKSPKRPAASTQLALPDGFDEFWSLYPKKAGEEDARQAWRQAVKIASPELIIAGLTRLLPTYEQRETRYVSEAWRWLKGRRWNDKPDPPKANKFDWMVEEARRFAAGDQDFEPARGATIDPFGEVVQ